MYKICNGDDEFEPRATPKPVTQFECLTTPTVPEVSLIFDKPFKEHAQTNHVPTSILKSAQSQSRRENIGSLPHPNNDESYAAWKKQNQFWKSPTANTDRSTNNKVPSSPARTTNVSSYHNGSQYVLTEFDNDAARHKSDEKYIQISNSRYNVAHSRQQNDKKRIQENENVNSRNNLIVSGHDQTLNDKILRRPMEVSSNQPNIVQNSEYPPTSHMGYHYPYLDTHGYPFPPFYAPPINTHNIENQETVKNLLQLVNSQSEQIKSLQLQVDRLLKMQEECFKERQRCSCQGLQQNDQIYTEPYDTIGSNPSYNRQAMVQSPNQQVSTRDHTKNVPNDNTKVKQSDSATSEFQTKKAYMEQKVSIGVMTSFEFTVQNNPFTPEIENYERSEIHKGNDNIQRCNAMNLCDKNETLRKYKNAFSRVPPGQLENIVEDSESYLSSSQQQTSNINSSASTRDIEKPVYIDGQKAAQYSSSDFPRLIDPGSKITKNQKRTQNDFETTYETKTDAQNVRNSMPQKLMPVSPFESKLAGRRNPSNVINRPMESSRQEYDHSKGVKDIPVVHHKEQQRKEFPTSTTNNPVDDSLILSSCDLKVNDRALSPEPSIHVEMNEYSSDDESEKVKRTSKVGWTFYNNVLGQVNQILQNTSVVDEKDHNRVKGDCNDGQGGSDNLAPLDTVKVATLEQLRKLGISLSENIDSGETNSSRMVYDSTFYPRLDHQANVTHTTSAVNETNTSMHMKALAMKYLSDDQLAELAIQRQGSTSLKQLMLSNMQGTNMSFATMRYLERYQLLPGKTNDTYEGNAKPSADISAKAELKYANQKQNPTLRFPFNQTPRTTCPSKILDISTLKQQPKLL